MFVSPVFFPWTIPPSLAPATPASFEMYRTRSVMSSCRPFERYASWVALSAAYDLIFLAASVLLFDYVLED